MFKQELYLKAKNSIVDADEEKALQVVEEARNMDIDLLDLLLVGFGVGNQEIGEQFDSGRISLPELIYASEVMKSVTDRILEILSDKVDPKESGLARGKVLLATVEGDVHDIGKGIVASTLRAAGFEVKDIGCEIPVEEIIAAAEAYHADIIGTSALLTSTLTEQKKLEKLLRDMGRREDYITMVGGAPCTPRWAKKIGADGYSEDAIEAVKVAQELMKKKEDNKKE